MIHEIQLPHELEMIDFVEQKINEIKGVNVKIMNSSTIASISKGSPFLAPRLDRHFNLLSNAYLILKSKYGEHDD
jgi:hypothetical protein